VLYCRKQGSVRCLRGLVVVIVRIGKINGFLAFGLFTVYSQLVAPPFVQWSEAVADVSMVEYVQKGINSLCVPLVWKKR